MCDEIGYAFLDFNGAAVEVLESISKFFQHLLGMWLLIHTIHLIHVSKVVIIL